MPAGRYSDTLKQPGLQAFLWTQFLGALNDNIYKMIVSTSFDRQAIVLKRPGITYNDFYSVKRWERKLEHAEHRHR